MHANLCLMVQCLGGHLFGVGVSKEGGQGWVGRIHLPPYALFRCASCACVRDTWLQVAEKSPSVQVWSSGVLSSCGASAVRPGTACHYPPNTGAFGPM
jgi:hypothetical protein